jgi:Zn-dependent M16 (insulinase) family peptidase
MTACHLFLHHTGERYRDFVVTKVQPIEELQCLLKELVHEPSGASVMQIECPDPENLFCLSFRTLPNDSKGAAHILEHTVLCGSRKYPVKDPFFGMTRRSLNTFMNALTGADFTCYPAATQVEKDFYNLLEVYLDAVFHPQLKELSFLQEGHRLEFAEPLNPDSPLLYKGIVYNEMKGGLSSPDSRLWHHMMAQLLPDLPYAHNAGGDPRAIPQLTYAELIEFHETYYHPSRCLFFFYGNLPLKKHLDFVADKALKQVPKLPPLPPIPPQPRFPAPVRCDMRYPIGESEDLQRKGIVSFGWLTVPLVNQEEVLALSVLESVLMETDASLLKHPLLASGLCIQTDALMDTEMSEVPFFIVCKGCDLERIDDLEQELFTQLEKIASQPIPEHLLEAAIHQLEFARTEIMADQAPFGLTLFMRSALAKQHNCEAEHALTIHALFHDLLQKSRDPLYLPGLIRKHFLDNPHFVRLVMRPCPKLTAEELAEEKAALAAIRKALTPQEVSAILKQTADLAAFQRETEKQSIACLPKVDLRDVPFYAHDLPLIEEEEGGLRTFRHTCFTNDVLYADLVFDLPDVSFEDLPLVQLMMQLLPELGAGARSYADNLDYASAHTGGIGASVALHVQANNPKTARPAMVIRGKALRRKADKLCGLLRDTVLEPRFDDAKRVEELILQIHSGLENKLINHALKYAIQLSLSGFSVPATVNNSWYGLRYYKKIQELARSLPKGRSALMEKLLALKEQLFSCKNPHLVLSCTQAMYQELQAQRFYGLTDLPQKEIPAWTGAYPLEPVPSHAAAVAAPLAFTALSIKTAPFGHPHAPALSASTLLLDHLVLHPKIREQGGAYGCGAQYGRMLGNYCLHAYRDPHIASTVRAFFDAIGAIAGGHFGEEDLEEAKLGVIQHLDLPLCPGARAITAYAWERAGKKREMRQHFRDKLLELSIKDVSRVVEKELLARRESGVIVCFSGKELIEREQEELERIGHPLPIQSF